MQIKTTKRYHCSPGRKVIIKKKKKERNNKCWWGCGEKEPSYAVGAATMEDSINIPQKIKNRTTIWSSFQGYLSKEYENTNLKKDTCTPLCSFWYYSQ